MYANVVEHPIRAKKNSYYNRGSGPRLVACSSIIRGKVIPLKLAKWIPFVIGASEGSDFVITGSTMRDSHVAIELLGDQWMISVVNRDAEVWVNNEPVQVAVLEHGDQVQLGRHLLLFLLDSGQGRATNKPSIGRKESTSISKREY